MVASHRWSALVYTSLGIKSVRCDVEAKQVLVEGEDGLDLCEMLAKWVSYRRMLFRLARRDRPTRARTFNPNEFLRVHPRKSQSNLFLRRQSDLESDLPLFQAADSTGTRLIICSIYYLFATSIIDH